VHEFYWGFAKVLVLKQTRQKCFRLSVTYDIIDRKVREVIKTGENDVADSIAG
jgi:hypothetical protein